MQRIKNTFFIGILLGLAICIILLVVLDAVFYFIKIYNGEKLLDIDVIFAICIIVNLLVMKKLFRTEDKHELAKGILISNLIWGAAYVYLFYISPVKSLFF